MIAARPILAAVCLAAALAAGAAAQAPSLRVYSELQRVDPFGKLVSADAPSRSGVRPREILSPAVSRRAHSCFRAAVTLPPGKSYALYVAQNPDDVFEASLYREIFVRRGEDWFPDALERVNQPARGSIPGPEASIPGQNTVTFLLDLWTPADRPPMRARVELQLYVDGDWIIYPMEVRIAGATLPAEQAAGVALPSPSSPADAAAREALRAYICGVAAPPQPAGGATVQGLILRNVVQDLALVRSIENKPGEKILPEILRLSGKGNAAAWCSAPEFPSGLGSEWYLRLRDFIYRMAE